jgi:copper chaperone CopZ
MKSRFLVFLLAGVLFSAALLVSWLFLPQGIHESRAALAEYDLQKLTCGSCVTNITTALEDLPGVGSVHIDLTNSRGRITFDPAETTADHIGRTISAAGYPASLRTQLDPQELAALRGEEARLVKKYVAQVGDRYVTRADFEAQVGQAAEGTAERGPDQLAVWNQLLQRELLLNAAAQNGVMVQDAEVDLRLQEILQQHRGSDALSANEFDGQKKFRERLREEMIIQRNFEDHVLAGISDPVQRRSLLQNWYNDLSARTAVKIFDPQLKALTTAKSGGCGGSCCG